MKRTIGLYLSPWRSDFLETHSGGNPLLAWRKLICQKANPRSREYMHREFLARWPEGTFIDATTEDDWRAAARDATEIVLLYPDAIGLGFLKLERAVAGLPDSRAVRVLNGRRRVFDLDSSARSALAWRRFLSYTMAGELAMSAVVLLLTPVLIAADLLRGRR